ncbi:amino acid adenylation domain-containing protein, partial [Streptomyces zhihengii]
GLQQLAGHAGQEGSDEQRLTAFARKTYRFYEGGRVTLDDVRALLAPRPAEAPAPGEVTGLTAAELGHLLRWLGPHRSAERLLPKYAYASPGALYATQLYLEIDGVAGLSGIYYHHPVDHTLVRVGDHPAAGGAPGLTLHFLGKRRAIEPVYRNNIGEVLEFEAGHMLGVLEEVLPPYGLTVRPAGHHPSVAPLLDAADDDHYLGTFAIVPHDGRPRPEEVELFVQAHGDRVAGLPGGLYRLHEGELVPVGADVVERRHVIAINQGVYDRASFGISAVSRASEAWRHYIVLGTLLHRLQRVPGMGLFRELRERRVEAPVTVLKARGDDYSSLESASGWSARPPRVVHLAGDHYEVLREDRVAELVAAIRGLDPARGG